MSGKIVSGTMQILLLVGMLTLAFDVQPVKAEPTTIIVPDDYSTIQAAINAATAGDTIYVKSGTYYEHLIVNKSLSLIGENKQTATIDGSATGDVVTVYADNVTISGFTIQGGGTDPFEGWFSLVVSSNDNVISENTFRNSAIGIVIRRCHRNIIHKNTFTAIMAIYAIRMYDSTNNKIIENRIMHAQAFSILTTWSSENEFSKNYVAPAPRNPKKIGGGIYLGNCDHNDITENVLDNSSSGIFLELSSCNNVEGNRIVGNQIGLRLGPFFHPSQTGSNDNCIFENDVMNNERGISMYYSNDNLIWRNNFVNNTSQFDNYDSTSSWDDGYPSGGNYWGDYNGTDFYSGPYQNITGSDGIGDTSYVIDEDNQDNYPLISPWTRLLGDIDGDGDIDPDDFSIFAGAYGTILGEPYYYARADLDQDGDVDPHDLAVFAANYGKTV